MSKNTILVVSKHQTDLRTGLGELQEELNKMARYYGFSTDEDARFRSVANCVLNLQMALDDDERERTKLVVSRDEAKKCGSCEWWYATGYACTNPTGPAKAKRKGNRNGYCRLWTALKGKIIYDPNDTFETTPD